MSERRFPLWFVLALLPLLVSQFVRLHQTEPWLWLACDYAGRLSMIAVLAAIPTARQIAFARVPSKLDAGEVAIWIVVLGLIYFFGVHFAQSIFSYLYPLPHLGDYPYLTGALRWVDLTLGLLLVAYSEELLFRRCAHAVLSPRLGGGWPTMLASALLFGAYHWPTGLWNMAGAALTGVMLMLLYRRSGAMWPVVTLHYLIDFILFSR